MKQKIRNAIHTSIKSNNHECLNLIFSLHEKETIQEIADFGIRPILLYLLSPEVEFYEAEQCIFHMLMMRVRLHRNLLPESVDLLELVYEKVVLLKNKKMIFYIKDFLNSYSPSTNKKEFESEQRILKFIEGLK